jgi:hypothetical protein
MSTAQAGRMPQIDVCVTRRDMPGAPKSAIHSRTQEKG